MFSLAPEALAQPLEYLALISLMYSINEFILILCGVCVCVYIIYTCMQSTEEDTEHLSHSPKSLKSELCSESEVGRLAAISLQVPPVL